MWNDTEFLVRLQAAADRFDRAEAGRLCNEMIAAIDRGEAIGDAAARRALGILRRKSFFELMERVAEALVLTEQASPNIRRQYAQALIDRGKLPAALQVLEALIERCADEPDEVAEARGLVGRVHKQLYVNARDPGSRRNQNSLRKAIAAYDAVYRAAPEAHLWHGINTVALAWRARRDLVPVEAAPDPQPLAREILTRVEARAARGRVDTWDLATAAEASVALGDPATAKRWLEEYVRRDDADAFELGSTLRQFREVWGFSVTAEPGATLLPLLESHLLERVGGRVELPARDLDATIARTFALEKVLGREGVVSVQWYRLGLERCRAVAQVRTSTGEGWGTGFVIRGRDLAPALGDELLLLTNAHVVTDLAVKDALAPDEAVVVFEARDEAAPAEHRVARLLWTSAPGDGPDDLDASLVRLDPPIAAPACPIASRLPLNDGRQKVYIVGHPGGRGLSFSLHDNLLLGYDERLLHYRAPTEPGSSGSPVFNQAWSLIGLHHAGSMETKKLGGETGTYAANEGVLIQRIQQQLRRAGVTA